MFRVPQLPRKPILTPFFPTCSIHYSMKLLFPEVFYFGFFPSTTPEVGILLFSPCSGAPPFLYLPESVWMKQSLHFLPPSLQFLTEFSSIYFDYVSVLNSHPSARHSAWIPMGLPCWPRNGDPLWQTLKMEKADLSLGLVVGSHWRQGMSGGRIICLSSWLKCMALVIGFPGQQP